jgi:hypothetical protein
MNAPAERPISAAFYLAAAAMGHKLGRPLPKGISKTDIGDWTLTLNNGRDELEGVPGFNVQAAHNVYFGVALFSPYGGLIGGLPEDKFIEDMKAHVPVEEWP